MQPNKFMRSATFDRAAANTEMRTVPMSVSSDTADILRYVGSQIGYERLLHDSLDNIDLTRFPAESGGPLLLDHSPSYDNLVGRFFVTGVDGGKLRGYAKFDTSARSEEAFQKVLNGTLVDTSIAYHYDPTAAKVDKTAPKRDYPTFDISSWILEEVSLVPVPADTTTGVGRSDIEVVIVSITEEEAEAAEPAGEELPCLDPATCTDETPCAVCAARCEPRSTTTNGRKADPTEVSMTDSIVAASTPANPANEILQLRSIAAALGKGREAEEILAAQPLEAARGLITNLLASAPALTPGVNVELSTKERKEYSYARAILNQSLRQEGQSSARGFEDEVSETIAKSLPAGYKSRGGVFVPMSTRAALDSATGTAGAELKYTEFGGELIELLRNMSTVIGSGARVLQGLQGNVSFPRQAGAATGYWLGENGSTPVTESEIAFSSVTLAPKTLMATTAFSRQLLTQSVLAVEPLVRQDLALIHALAIDKAALHGTGSNSQPTGIYRTTGVSTQPMGGVPTFGKLQDMISALAASNALRGNPSFLTTPGMAGLLAQTLVAQAAGSKMIWDGPYDNATVNGYSAKATNQVSALMDTLVDTGSSEHGIIFGNWQDLLLGFWGAMEVVSDIYAQKKLGNIEVTSWQLCDIELRHPQSFSVATGATLS